MRGVKEHSARFLANPYPGRDWGGEGWETERSARLATDGGIARGIRKDLWPKYFPKCPVARHFVCVRRSMLFAIANALLPRMYGMPGRVGFALGRKLLL